VPLHRCVTESVLVVYNQVTRAIQSDFDLWAPIRKTAGRLGKYGLPNRTLHLIAAGSPFPGDLGFANHGGK
jgi:hypothetical protein